MKKSTLGICMAATVMMSAMAGYGGAVLAHYTLNPTYESLSYSANADNEYAALVQPLAAALDLAQSEDGGEAVLAEAFYAAATMPVSISQTSLSIPAIAQKVADTVVEIETEKASRLGQYVKGGAGSGVIIATNGYIVTNNHVIEEANRITVRLRNGNTYTATLAGRDIKTDLAVIKIEAFGLPTASFGDSDQLVVGELAVAIGNPLGELGGTVTEGIISALNRDITLGGEKMNLLQTSAAVNSGNSGGGLFNQYGELIGLVNAKSSGSGIEGLGFAIPSNTVKTVTNQLVEYGYVPGRVDFGIDLIDISDTFTALRYSVSSLGVYVSKNDSDSGLSAGDRIVAINGASIRYSADIKSECDKYKVGDVLTVTVSRGGREMNFNVTLKQAKFL